MKRSLTTGLTVLIPLGVTAFIVLRAMHLLTRPFVHELKLLIASLKLPFTFSPSTLYLTAQALIVLGILLIILGVGLLAQTKALKRFVIRLELALKAIPLIRLVYDPVHGALKKLLNPKTPVFTGARMLPLGGIDALCCGVGVDGTPLSYIEKKLGSPIEVFLLLGVPNPLMGFLLLAPKSSSNKSPMNLEETLKYMVSCGLIHPRKGGHHA